MKIVRARPEDAPALTALAMAAKRHWGYPESWMESWREALTIRPAFVAAQETYVALLQRVRAGFHALKVEDGTIHLEHLWVRPAFWGRGVGRALFAHAVGRAGALGFGEIKIESDPNAEEFINAWGPGGWPCGRWSWTGSGAKCRP